MRIHRQREQYWSNTKFADWIRSFGELEKPKAATMEEWKQYRTESPCKSPTIYWLAETGLTKAQNIVYFPADVFNMFRIYIVNRLIDRTHLLPTKLPVGDWYDVDTKLLHASFEALVDFIEIEKAWMEVIFNDRAWKERGYPWWHRYRLTRWTRRVRCPEAGLAYLAWEMSLTDPDHRQAEMAGEQLALYNWWKFSRPARMESHNITDMTFERGLELEQQYEKDDEEMLIRLIKIRKSLWT